MGFFLESGHLVGQFLCKKPTIDEDSYEKQFLASLVNVSTVSCEKVHATTDYEPHPVLTRDDGFSLDFVLFQNPTKICTSLSLRHQSSYSQIMIGMFNHLLSIVFGFHYHSQEVII